MDPVTGRPAPRTRPSHLIRNWTCPLCTHSNPDDEDICCQQCGAGKR